MGQSCLVNQVVMPFQFSFLFFSLLCLFLSLSSASSLQPHYVPDNYKRNGGRSAWKSERPKGAAPCEEEDRGSAPFPRDAEEVGARGGGGAASGLEQEPDAPQDETSALGRLQPGPQQQPAGDGDEEEDEPEEEVEIEDEL